MADHLQVQWVAAQAVITLVVYLLLAGDVAVVVAVHDKVNCHCLAVEGHAAIATTLASARVWPCPDVVGAWLIVQNEAKIGDLDSFIDAYHDLSSSGGQLT